MNLEDKILYFLIFLFFSTGSLKAVELTDTIKNYNSIATKEIMLLRTPWSKSENAGSLSYFNYYTKIGSASIYSEIQNKDYRLYREGDILFKTGFFTDGFVKYKNWNFYGNFNYYSQTEKNVKWTEVMNPYNENPYSIGDSVGGNYSKEYFNMEAKASFLTRKNLVFGIDIKYSTGVGAKRKDPRPENTVTTFNILPGIIFQKSKIKLGANLRYTSGKEDIEISTVTNNIFYIFHFKGLGVFTFTPEFDGQFYCTNLFGGGLQFNFNGDKIQNLTEINFYKKSTNIKSGDTYPLQIALLQKYNTKINSTFIFPSKKQNISRLYLFLIDKYIYGDEPVVEPKLEAVSYQWSTVAKYTLYWYKEDAFGFTYSYYKILDKNHFNWGGQFSGNFKSSKTTYYFVPEYNEQQLNLLNVNVRFEKGFQIQNGDIILEFNGGYRKNYNGKLYIVEDEYLQSTVNSELVLHDFDYFNSRLLLYGFSAKVGKNISVYQNPMQAYIQAGINNIISALPEKPKSTFFELKLGTNF